MATNLSCTKKLDGLIVVSKEWSVFKHLMFVNLKSTAIQILKESNFKGVRFGTKFVYRLFIGYYGSFWISLAFENKDGMAFCNKSKQVIQKTVNECLKNNHSTQRTYQQNFEKLRSKLRNSVSEVYLLVSQLGQDVPFSAINEYEHFFDFEKVSQLIVHYAVDYTEAHSALFFAKEDLGSLMGSQNLKKSMQYFVCLLHGVGNFYYNVDSRMSTKQGVFFQEAKFYSELFKTCHNTKMFRRAEICQLLMDPREVADDELMDPSLRRKFKSLHQYFEDVKKIKSVITGITNPNFKCGARFEAIVRLLPLRTGGSRLLNPVMRPHHAITELFKDHIVLSAHNIGKCLIKLTPHQLKHHLETNVLPFLTTLEVYLERRIRALEGNQFDLFTPQMYLNCVSAEAVVSFCIYGNCNRRNGTQMYPKWLQDKLQLKIEDYSDVSNGIVSNWLFKNVKINRLKDYEVDQSYTITVLEYMGVECLFQAEIEGCLLSNPNFKLVSELRSPLIEIYKKARMRGTILYDRIGMRKQRRILINRVIKVIVHISYQHFLKKPASTSNVQKKLEKIFKKCEHSTQTDLISTQKFVQDIVANRTDDFIFVSWLWELLTYIDPPQAKTFQTQLKESIEETLFEVGLFLPIPRHDQPFTYSLVVPFEGTDRVNFRTVLPETLRKIRDNLHKHFFAIEGIDISPILLGRNPSVKTLEDFVSSF